MFKVKKIHRLPFWSRAWLSLWCQQEVCEELEGDIIANFNWRMAAKKPFGAHFHLIRDTLLSLRFFSSRLLLFTDMLMITNYLKIYYRNILREKGSYAFRMIGLVIGILSFLSVLSYYQFEQSFDTYHMDSDRIFRVERTVIEDGAESHKNGTSYLLPQFTALSIPEISRITGIVNSRHDHRNFQYPKGTPIYDLKYLPVRKNFFEIFTMKFLEGDEATALSSSNAIIITRSTRERLFKDDTAIGKIVYIQSHPRQVTGVIEDVPLNTHFSFDYLLSIDNVFEGNFWNKDRLSSDWKYANFIFHYVKLESYASLQAVETKLNALYESKKDPDDPSQVYKLRPVTAIHLQSHSDWELADNTNPNFVKMILVLGIIILILTTINYAFINIAKVAWRSKEQGLRKLMGSTRYHLAYQLIFENILTLIIAFFLALIGIYFLRIYIPAFFPIQIHFDQLLTLNILIISFFILVLIGIISAIYPILTQFKMEPLDAIKGKNLGKERKFGLLHGLVLLQIFFSLGLLTSTLYFQDQINFILTKDPGFKVENIAYMERYVRGTDAPPYQAFKEELLALPGISSVCNSAQLPLRWPAGHNYELVRKGDSDGIMTSRAWIGYEYFKTLEVKLTMGREFSRDFPSDTAAIIISKSAVEEMGLKSPIGQTVKIFFRGRDVVRERKIIGVVNDFNYRTLHSELLPHYYILAADAPVITLNFEDIGNIHTIAEIEKLWKKFSPEEAFNFIRLSDHFEQQYKTDISLRNAIQLLSVIMIILASMGIFGVSAYLSQRRIKEISIRKVMGANSRMLYFMQMRGYFLLVILALFISILPVYFWVDRWLETYAYRIQISPFNFVIACISILIIISMVAGYHTLKVALLNPVKTLKNE